MSVNLIYIYSAPYCTTSENHLCKTQYTPKIIISCSYLLFYLVALQKQEYKQRSSDQIIWQQGVSLKCACQKVEGYGSNLRPYYDSTAQCQVCPELPHLAANRFNLISTSIHLAITLPLLSQDTTFFILLYDSIFPLH